MRFFLLPILFVLLASPLQAQKASKIDESNYKTSYKALDKYRYQKSENLVGSFQDIYIDYPQDDHNHKSVIKKLYLDDDGRFYKLKKNSKVKKSKKKLTNKRIRSTGNQKVLIVALADPDVSSDSLLYSPELIEEVYFSQTKTSVHKYYKEVSDEAVSFSGEIAGLLVVRGLCEGGNIFENGGAEFVLDEIDKQYDLSNYNTISFLLPDDRFCLGGALGVGSVGNIQYQGSFGTQVDIAFNFNVSAGATFGNSDYFVKVVGHEFGHNFGLPHDNGNACGEDIFNGECDSLEYGGVHSLMGFSPNLAHLNAIHQEDLGWLKQDQIAVIDDDSFQGEFTIAGLSRNNTTDLKAIKIKRDDGSYYVIEYREAVRMDSVYFLRSRLFYSGLQIYVNNNSFGSESILLRKDFEVFDNKDSSFASDFFRQASFNLGEPFYDSVSDIRVTLIELGSRTAKVLVEKKIKEVVDNGGGISEEPDPELEEELRLELVEDQFIAVEKVLKTKLSFKINGELPVKSKIRVRYPSGFRKILKFNKNKRNKKIKSSNVNFLVKIAKRDKLDRSGFINSVEIPLTVDILDIKTKSVSESYTINLVVN